MQAVGQANIQQGEKILEMAVGPGLNFLEMAKRVERDTQICGVDLSALMLHLIGAKVQQVGFFQTIVW